MGNEIKALTFPSSSGLTISLGGLASSDVGVGRQSAKVDNTSTRYQQLLVWAWVKQGANPTGNKSAALYFLRDDNNGHRDDGAGIADSGITILNAEPVRIGVNKASPVTGEVIYIPSTIIHNPGPSWMMAIVHNTGVDLDASDVNSGIAWVGLNPEIQ